MANTLFYHEIGGVKVPVIFEEDKSLPTANLKLIFLNSGSMKDGAKLGISKMSFKLLNEGTKKLGSVKFAENLDEKAIKLSAYSGFETAGIEFSSLKENLKEGARLTGELLKDPNLTDETLQKIKIMTISSIAKKEDDFDHVADSALKEHIFKKTPLEFDGTGTKKTVENIKLSDIAEFLKSHITLSNTVAVIGGDMTKEEAIAALEAAVKPLKGGHQPSVTPFFDAEKTPKEIRVKKETKQAYIYFGAPFYLKADDKDSHKAKLASFILGSSGFGSRLMEIIRVKNGLAYSAYARHNTAKSNSYFSGHLQTKIENEEKAKELVKKTVDEFIKDGATQKELDGAKNFILGSEPLRNETLSQRLSRSFNEFYIGKPLGFHKEELQLIKETTLEELNAFIKSHPEIAILSFAVVSSK